MTLRRRHPDSACVSGARRWLACGAACLLAGCASFGSAGSGETPIDAPDKPEGGAPVIDTDDGGGDASPPPPMSFVQQGTADNEGTTTDITVNPTQPGDLIVVIVAVETNGTTTVSSIADDAPEGSSIYASANLRAVDSKCGLGLEIWFAKGIRGGAKSITVTMADSVRIEAWAIELAGSSTVDPFDRGAVASDQPSGPIITAPNVTPSGFPALVVSGAVACGEVSGLRSPTNFTALPIVNGDAAAYIFATSPGAYGAEWNNSSGGDDTWIASTAVFR